MNLCTKCKLRPRDTPELCNVCSNERSRAYSRTPKGYLVRTYRAMLNRVRGINKKAAKTGYEGKAVCSKEDFYTWSLDESSNFLSLLKIYEDEEYDLCFSPSIDRIDPARGYELDNLQWLSRSENSSRTTSNNKPEGFPIGICMKREKFLVSKSVRGVKYIKEFYTLEEARDYLDYILNISETS